MTTYSYIWAFKVFAALLIKARDIKWEKLHTTLLFPPIT